MFIKAYLRASTKEQDANRAKDELITLAAEHGNKIAAFYTENESGAMLERLQLMQLINDASEGDVILVEQIARLNQIDLGYLNTLKRKLSAKRLSMVSKELYGITTR